MKTRISLFASVLVAGVSSPAVAETPPTLRDLLEAARQHALPVRNQRAAVAVADANQAAAKSALWPRLSATISRNSGAITHLTTMLHFASYSEP